MLTTDRVNHLQPLWFSLTLRLSFCDGLCLVFSPWFFFFATYHCFTSFHREFTFPHISFQMRLFLPPTLSISSRALFFTHRASIEIYQCQMKHRILLNLTFSHHSVKWARLKRIEMNVFFFACVGNRCHHHLIIHFMIHWEFLFRF